MQWYPPVTTIPPPPPPPSNDEVEEASTTESSPKKEETENDIVKDSEPTNIDSTCIKSEEKVETPIEEESPALQKEKDKELMNQIKERIKRKKEEKLKKEQGDKKKSEKGGEDVSKIQKEKEETLREKLIKKKLERETKTDSKQNENDIEPWNDFSVDIFATGTSGSKRERKDSDTKHDKVLPSKENRLSQSKISQSDFTTSTNTLRLIDAGYGDDDGDDEDDEEEKNNEEKKNVPQDTMSIQKSEKSTENNDNYADMLLEGNYKT